MLDTIRVSVLVGAPRAVFAHNASCKTQIIVSDVRAQVRRRLHIFIKCWPFKKKFAHAYRRRIDWVLVVPRYRGLRRATRRW